MSKEAMKLALEALESLSMNDYSGYEISKHETYKIDNAITVLTEALAEQPAQKRPQNCGTGYCSCIECVMEPAQQEPDNSNDLTIAYMAGVQRGKELAQRTWVGLTDEKIIKIFNAICNGKPFGIERILELHKAIEAALRSKNT